ncbi:MAG: 1-hydroxycarotenoid 3,4-desaturase CrtD [Pseudomonadota bacterium]
MRVIVIGAGVGGLSAAIALAGAGVETVLIEGASSPGGKMRGVNVGEGPPIDGGPTVFTMRWAFDELFEAAGARLDDWTRLEPLAILARHAWPDHPRSAPGDSFDLHADLGRAEDAVAAFAGPPEAKRYRRFCERARTIYDTLERTYMADQKPDPLTLARRIGPTRLRALWNVAPLQTMAGSLGMIFTDPRLRQLFGRYATYCGSSPYLAPQTLMLVAHVEQAGVWSVAGGMHGFAADLDRFAAHLGVERRYGEEVSEILVEHGRASGVRLAGGDTLRADAIISNADVSAYAAGALGPQVESAAPPTAPRDRSLSAFVWTLRAETAGFPLIRHNVFFSADYRKEFADIFERGRTPAAPTVYVCAQDRPGADAPRPLGPERLQILTNAPARADWAPFTAQEIAECETATFETLARAGLEIQRRAADQTLTTPNDFAAAYPATGGAIYGRANHGLTASFQRPGAQSRIPGLYLASGSAHPGPGVPMAALSGRLAASALMADRASTPRFRPAGISGGTSTGSRKTAVSGSR